LIDQTHRGQRKDGNEGSDGETHLDEMYSLNMDWEYAVSRSRMKARKWCEGLRCGRESIKEVEVVVELIYRSVVPHPTRDCDLLRYPRGAKEQQHARHGKDAGSSRHAEREARRGSSSSRSSLTYSLMA
jgi:hypothetical protein